MDLKNILGIHDPQLASTMVTYAVRPTTIWTLRSDSTIYIFKRSNPKIFNRFIFNGHDANSARMAVDPNGEKCIIYWDRPPILFFSLATQQFEIVKSSKTFRPSAATWGTAENKNPYVIVGSYGGEVLYISGNEGHDSYLMYTFDEPRAINEMHFVLQGDLKFVFLLIGDEIVTFIGTEKIEMVFAKGPSNKVLFLGSVDVVLDHRIIISEHDGNPCISAIHKYGIISFIAEVKDNDQVSFIQDIQEVSTENIMCFAESQWGLLLVYDKNILLMYQTKPKASLTIPHIEQIHADSEGIVMFNATEIITIKLSDFRTYMVYKMVHQKDYKFALFVAQNDKIRYFVVQKQIERMSVSKAGEYIATLGWTTEAVAEAIGIESQPMIFYLRAMLGRIHGTNQRALRATSLWAFHLHCKFFPELEDEFTEFIRQHYKLLDPKMIKSRLTDIGFRKGLAVYDEVCGNAEAAVERLYKEGDIDGAIVELSKMNDQTKAAKFLTRLIKSDIEKVKRYARKNKRRIPMRALLPVLAFVQPIAHEFVTEYMDDPETISLLVIALCNNNETNDLVKLPPHRFPLTYVYRFATYFKCTEAAAKVLVRMDRPRDAVRTAHAVGEAFENLLIASIKNTEQQKLAWLELFDVSDSSKKPAVLSRIMATGLFTFEDLINIFDDDALLFEYGDDMTEAVRTLEKGSEVVTFDTVFPETAATAFQLHVGDCCPECLQPLLGTRFAAFPCGHRLHTRCLQRAFVARTGGDGYGFFDSCPICGMLALGEVGKDFL